MVVYSGSKFSYNVLIKPFSHRVLDRAWSSSKSVLKWFSFKAYSRHSAVFLGKTFYGTFPCLVVLASTSKFLSYLYKAKKTNNKFQADSNILVSLEVGRGNCLLYVLASPALCCESGG